MTGGRVQGETRSAAASAGASVERRGDLSVDGSRDPCGDRALLSRALRGDLSVDERSRPVAPALEALRAAAAGTAVRVAEAKDDEEEEEVAAATDDDAVAGGAGETERDDVTSVDGCTQAHSE
jgi:hypothetical protein